MKKNYLITILFLVSISLFAQKPEFKFGKIDMADMEASKCPIDSTADAYILGDFGYSYFEYSDTKDNFQTIFRQHFRIKILKKTAFHWADVVIPLYKYNNGNSEERITSFKASTFNIENGKIVASKVEKSATFKEEVNKSRINYKFTFPNVKEGSIIEVDYEITSDSWNIRDWDFQSTIPTLVTQYEIRIPEYFNFKLFQNGYESLKTYQKSDRSSFSYSYYYEDSNGQRIPNSRQTASVDYLTNISTYEGNNIKAFHDEPYMSSRRNYLTSIEYELQSTQFPHSLFKLYTSDWKSITKTLLDYEFFGEILRRKGATDDIVALSTTGLSQPLDKTKAIYEFIRDHFKWDKTNRLYAKNSLKKTIENKSGNSADINLLLVTALREAGIKADPVVLSTRDNGFLLMSYPILQKLNYIIAMAEIDGKQFLMDATDKNAPFGLIPEKCINGQGRIIREDNPGDVDLNSSQVYSQSLNLNLKISENADLSGTWEEIHKGYAAHDERERIGDSKSKEDYINDRQKQNAGLTISKFTIENADSLALPLTMKFDVTMSGQTESTGNLLMIHPLLYEQLKKNPFTLEERNFPVDYSHAYSLTFVETIEIPDGYQVESLPKPTNISLPGKSASFMFNAMVNGSRIQIIRRFTINKTMFLPDEYSNLKEFYNQRVAKEGEVIVLKKI